MAVSQTSDTSKLSLLGNQKTTYLTDYSPEVLETFENKHPDNDYVVSFDAYEFTSKCLTGDTLIEVARDESKYPKGIPIKDLVGTSGYVFGFDPDIEEPVCKRYHSVRKTGEKMPVLKIRLDCVRGSNVTGTLHHEESCIRCTPDHLILVKTHRHQFEWIEAQHLQPGMHLVYSQTANNDKIREMNKYRLIACAVHGKPLYEISEDDVHHRDGNHLNNSPDNLEIKTKFDHLHDHQSVRYGYDVSLDVDKLVRLYNSGVNIHQLSKIYGCDNGTIKDRLVGKVKFRTQSESLRMSHAAEFEQRDIEICELYQRGYTSYEIGEYLDLHPTTILQILRENDVSIRGANDLRKWRKSNPLPPLNHRVISVDFDGFEDVYNMEVEGIHNFFANDMVVHNCPKTGQPDFAKVVISYIPNVKMVESKSLKLYLFSFRNHGSFHEDCMNMILEDLIELMDPKYIEVKGIFSPRGGISIFPFVNWANPEFEYQTFAMQRKLDALKDASNRAVRYDM